MGKGCFAAIKGSVIVMFHHHAGRVGCAISL